MDEEVEAEAQEEGEQSYQYPLNHDSPGCSLDFSLLSTDAVGKMQEALNLGVCIESGGKIG